jgi:hypothetical protein
MSRPAKASQLIAVAWDAIVGSDYISLEATLERLHYMYPHSSPQDSTSNVHNIPMILRFLSIGPKVQQEWTIGDYCMCSSGRFAAVLAQQGF